MWIQISQLLKKLADQNPTVYHAAYFILHSLVDTIMILIIASDGYFYLLSAKFDPCRSSLNVTLGAVRHK